MRRGRMLSVCFASCGSEGHSRKRGIVSGNGVDPSTSLGMTFVGDRLAGGRAFLGDRRIGRFGDLKARVS